MIISILEIKDVWQIKADNNLNFLLRCLSHYNINSSNIPLPEGYGHHVS